MENGLAGFVCNIAAATKRWDLRREDRPETKRERRIANPKVALDQSQEPHAYRQQLTYNCIPDALPPDADSPTSFKPWISPTSDGLVVW